MITENEIYLSTQENPVCSRSYSPHCSLMNDPSNLSPHPSAPSTPNKQNLSIDTLQEKTLMHKKSVKNLSLFSQNFNQLVSDIKRMSTPVENEEKINNASKKVSFNLPNQPNKTFERILQHPKRIKTAGESLGFNPEESILHLTNTERISDFYNYTEECMQKILTLPQPKPEKLKKVTIGNKHHRKCLVLFDLDETLVHCTGPIKTSKTQYQNEVEVKLPMGKKVKIDINIRPFLEKSLKLIKQYYTVAFYTASHQSYTDAVLDLIDLALLFLLFINRM